MEYEEQVDERQEPMAPEEKAIGKPFYQSDLDQQDKDLEAPVPELFCQPTLVLEELQDADE